MARTNLSQAARQRKAAKGKTTKTKQEQSVSVPSVPAPPPPSAKSNGLAQTQTDISGLTSIAPNDLHGSMPQYDGTKYQVFDPLNPPETIPQVSETEFDSRNNIYQGGIRALKLTGVAFDLTRERFTTEGKKAKAFGAGIKAATSFEQTRADHLDWQNQLETNKQKQSTLSQSQHKTKHLEDLRVEQEAELDEKLEQARISTDHAREQTKDKRSKLEEFRKQLGVA